MVGVAAAVILWFSSVSSEPQRVLSNKIEETIILPKGTPERFRQLPEVTRYLHDLSSLRRQGKTVLPLDNDELDHDGTIAQAIVLNDSRFLEDTTRNGEILHNDMMQVRPAIVSELTAKTQKICKRHRCYEAQKYNFATNTTTRAIIDIDTKNVLDIERFSDSQPDINRRLTRIAEAIALGAPEVWKALGYRPARNELSMANVRSSLQGSPCENSEHLCVAPTFADHKKARALWAIVDLTDLKLAAAKWAGLGKTTTPACIDERTLQNRYIMRNFCQKDTHLQKNGWEFIYRLTGSDGLEIRDVRFHGHPVLRSAKIVDWHVSYQQASDAPIDTSTEAYIEGRRVEFVQERNGSYFFGYNDAMGCPMFSTSVVLPFNGPQIVSLTDGFAISQDFRNPKWPMACNYRYENRFEFYNDGSFRVVGINKGRGCGDQAIYRPVMRIDTALSDTERFFSFEHGKWKLWQKEAKARQNDGGYEEGKYRFKITDTQGHGYRIEPGSGKFSDGGRGDDARIYVTRFHPKEGDKDLLTLGSCCNLSEDGPERFMKPPETIADQDIVLWYVPRIHNDARSGHEYCWADTHIDANGNVKVEVWPCSVGPRFIPLQKER